MENDDIFEQEPAQRPQKRSIDWMSVFLRIASYVLVALIAVYATAAYLTDGGTPVIGNPGQSKLDVLQQLIEERFIGDVDSELLMDAAANALINATGDRWSYYISAEDYAAYEEQKKNAYVGIGITISQEEDQSGLLVLEVATGGGAEEAGMLAGDKVIGVNGQSIANMDLDAVKNMIRGDSGTTVELTVQRQEQTLHFTVERRAIRTAVAVGQMLDGNIGLITIENFNQGCYEETIAAVETLLEQGAQKLIFDVRNNPGGYASQLVDVLDYLLPEGPLFRTVDYTGKESLESSDAKCLQMPMAVLVNGNSYSAAEFFAAALSEYEWATVVGEKTSGKGYFQVTYKLFDGSAVALSVGKYFTPLGVSLADVGITPDEVVPVDQKTAAAIYAGTLDPMQDPQILKAIEALNK